MRQEYTGGRPAGAAAPQVSIIVPIYNVVNYLSRCLNSLASQTIPVEIVMVDDGSTDASGAVADWYAAKYNFMHVIHQHNRGLGPARNAGLAASSAPFVAFVDSDDYVSDDYAEKLLTAIRRTQADIAVCAYTSVSISGLRWRGLAPRLLAPALTGAKAMRLLVRDVSIKTYAWNKMFRRTLFTDKGIAFPNIMFEDIATMPRLFARARRVAIVKRSLYTYCRRPGCLMRMFTPKRISDNINALTMVRDFLLESGAYRNYKNSYAFLVAKFALSIMIDTLHMHLKYHLPRPFPAAGAAFKLALGLSKPAVDPEATIEALTQLGMRQAVQK